MRNEDIKIDYLYSLMNIVPLFEDDMIVIDISFIKIGIEDEF